MEAISNIAGAASKAIWGENETDGKEPVSGETGNTKAGEPYDAGNLESTTADPTSPSSNVGPITDARDASSKTVSTSGNSKEPGPVAIPLSSYLPSTAANTEPIEGSKGATGASTAGSEKPVQDGKMPIVGENAQSLTDSHAVGTSTESAPAIQKVKSEHGGLSADRGTADAAKIKEAEKETAGAPASGIGGGDSKSAVGKTPGGTGKGQSMASGGAARGAGGTEGGAAEGEEHRSSGSKFGAFKSKIKAKLHVGKSDKS